MLEMLSTFVLPGKTPISPLSDKLLVPGKSGHVAETGATDKKMLGVIIDSGK